MKDKELKTHYEYIVNEYCRKFCSKHDFIFNDDMWVGDCVGNIIFVDEFYINFQDIKYDIDNNIDKDLFFDWYDYSYNISLIEGLKNVNYSSFCKGFRPYTYEQIYEMQKKKDNLEKLKEDFIKEIESFNNQNNENSN